MSLEKGHTPFWPLTYRNHDVPTGSISEKTEPQEQDNNFEQHRPWCSHCPVAQSSYSDRGFPPLALSQPQLSSELQGQYTKEVYLSRKGVTFGKSAGQWPSRVHYAIGRVHTVLAKAPPYVVLEHVCLT